jgi:hypothetical protein
MQIDDSLALIANSVDEIVAQRDQARAEAAELREQRDELREEFGRFAREGERELRAVRAEIFSQLAALTNVGGAPYRATMWLDWAAAKFGVELHTDADDPASDTT